VGGFLAGGVFGLVVAPGEPRTRGAEVAWNLAFAAVGLTYSFHMQFVTP